VSDAELIKIAVKSMGLDELYPFKPEEKIIEYALAAEQKKAKPGRHDRQGFVHETASESKAPGGGSISSAMGAFGAALGTMVANLSSHKRGWDDRWEEFSDWAERGKRCHDELLKLVDDDTDAFNEIVSAWRLPDRDRTRRRLREAGHPGRDEGGDLVPVPRDGGRAGIDGHRERDGGHRDRGFCFGCGRRALAARSAVIGAYLNVKINAGDVDDKAWLDDILTRGADIQSRAAALETEILEIVAKKI
jgi:glutamate formiminotransferase/formiminotetrahydrofolate cyclodeaminase